jgi:hypothetical protein
MLLFQAVSRLHCGGFCEQTAEEESGDQALPLPLPVQVPYTLYSCSLAHLDLHHFKWIWMCFGSGAPGIRCFFDP